MNHNYTAVPARIFTRDSLRARINPWPAARIKCADGFSVSVQAGRTLYCTPREDGARWTSVEVGFPTDRLPASFAEYADNPSDPLNDLNLNSVWGYVPIEMVVDLLNSHGGEVP